MSFPTAVSSVSQPLVLRVPPVLPVLPVLLAREQRAEAVEVLAAAFRDNPLNRAVIGEPAERRLRCNRAGSGAALEVALGLSHCSVALDAGAIAGVLLADPPGLRERPFPGFARQLRSLLGQGFRVARRWSQVHFEIDRLRPAEPHWYLDMLGVAPTSQGRGHGSALLRQWLERVDADGAPSYLETDRAKNLPLYQRAGYSVQTEEQVLGTPVWRLWRPARAPGTHEPLKGGRDVR